MTVIGKALKHKMNELRNEIAALIDKLESQDAPEGRTEQITLGHLKGLMAPADSAEIQARFAGLEQFWASSVAWCSELSKDLEKIIIMHRELL